MKKVILFIVIILMSCSKEEGDDCCQTVFKDGIEYNIDQCDDATLERIKQFASQKELSLMDEASNCD